jgi:hypothetical protein
VAFREGVNQNRGLRYPHIPAEETLDRLQGEGTVRTIAGSMNTGSFQARSFKERGSTRKSRWTD